MTVSSTVRKAGPFSGTGLQTAYPFSFKVFATSDVLVVKTDLSGNITTLVLGSDYSVALNSDQDGSPGGTVNMAVAPPSGYQLTIGSQVPQLQSTIITNNGGFYPAIITAALDKLTILVQQLQNAFSTTLQLPFGSTASTTLPTPAANKFLTWNATATGLQNSDGSTLASIVAYGTAVRDLFTGDGTTKTFTLSNSPATQANLDVDIGGVTQTGGIDFTWLSGTTLTFTVAPPNGARVQVRYMQALAQGSADSGSVAFSHTGGYGQGTVGLALQATVNAKNAPYNAKGDGVTDDTAAIQLALNTGKRVYLPAGVYKTTATLVCNGLDFVLTGDSLGVMEERNLASLEYSGSCIYYQGSDANHAIYVANTGTLSQIVLQNLRVIAPKTNTTSIVRIDGITSTTEYVGGALTLENVAIQTDNYAGNINGYTGTGLELNFTGKYAWGWVIRNLYIFGVQTGVLVYTNGGFFNSNTFDHVKMYQVYRALYLHAVQAGDLIYGNMFTGLYVQPGAQAGVFATGVVLLDGPVNTNVFVAPVVYDSGGGVGFKTINPGSNAMYQNGLSNVWLGADASDIHTPINTPPGFGVDALGNACVRRIYQVANQPSADSRQTISQIIDQNTCFIDYPRHGASNDYRITPGGFATPGLTLDGLNQGAMYFNQSAGGYANTNSWSFSGGGFIINHDTTALSGYSYALFGYNGAGIGSITQSGTAAVLYNTTSDYRLKENVAPVSGGLAKILALNPVDFTWKADGRPDTGFLAHEFQAVIPNNVTGEKDAADAEGNPVYQQMDNSGAVPYLVAALKELKAEFDAYKLARP